MRTTTITATACLLAALPLSLAAAAPAAGPTPTTGRYALVLDDKPVGFVQSVAGGAGGEGVTGRATMQRDSRPSAREGVERAGSARIADRDQPFGLTTPVPVSLESRLGPPGVGFASGSSGGFHANDDDHGD